MALYLYGRNVPNFKHEKNQIIEIINQLEEIYKTSDEYCYCFINAEWENKDIPRQYDLLIFERHCISIIELKSWSGKLSLNIKDNEKNPSIYKIQNGKNSRDLPWGQIQHEQSYLKHYLSYTFRNERKLDKDMKFRIDHYIVFNSPLNIENVKINGIIKKWLSITTIDDFKLKFTASNKNQPFLLKEEDIKYIAHNKFKMEKKNIDNIFLSNIQAIELFSNNLKSLNKFDYDDNFLKISNGIHRNLDNKEPQYILEKMKNIHEIILNNEERKLFKEDIDKIEGYLDDESLNNLIEDRFVNSVISIMNILIESYNINSIGGETLDLIKNYMERIQTLILEKENIKLSRELMKNDRDALKKKRILETLNLLLKYEEGLI